MSRIKPIAIIQSMSGKVCEHSDMYFRTNKQTQKVCTGKICNPSDVVPSEAQLRVQSRFAKISAAVDVLLTDPAELLFRGTPKLLNPRTPEPLNKKNAHM